MPLDLISMITYTNVLALAFAVLVLYVALEFRARATGENVGRYSRPMIIVLVLINIALLYFIFRFDKDLLELQMQNFLKDSETRNWKVKAFNLEWENEKLMKSNKNLGKIIASYPELIKPSYFKILNGDIRFLEPTGTLSKQGTGRIEFVVEQGSKKKLADGRYEIRFAIDAVGMLLVPEFILNCKTQNNAEIVKFDII